MSHFFVKYSFFVKWCKINLFRYRCWYNHRMCAKNWTKQWNTIQCLRWSRHFPFDRSHDRICFFFAHKICSSNALNKRKNCWSFVFDGKKRRNKKKTKFIIPVFFSLCEKWAIVKPTADGRVFFSVSSFVIFIEITNISQMITRRNERENEYRSILRVDFLHFGVVYQHLFKNHQLFTLHENWLCGCGTQQLN